MDSLIVKAAEQLSARLRGCSWREFSHEEQAAIGEMLRNLACTAPPWRDSRNGQRFNINPIQLALAPTAEVQK